MEDIINLNRREKNISGEFYRKIIIPIEENSKANYDINISLGSGDNLKGRVIEITESENSLSPDVYVPLEFKFETVEGVKLIDSLDVTMVWDED